MALKWEQIEPGWHVAEGFGICLERDQKWHVYTTWGPAGVPVRSFKTLKGAKEWAEKNAKGAEHGKETES